MNQTSSEVRARVSPQEWDARVQLAAAHRLMAHSGVSDLTYNHLSLRVPGEPNQFLVKPGNWMFEEVTASGLYKFDFDGKPFQDSPPCRGGRTSTWCSTRTHLPTRVCRHRSTAC
jgi:ribulose-5-phosphate 4-epimerase/fuculose-1-phosphate aldolase